MTEHLDHTVKYLQNTFFNLFFVMAGLLLRATLTSVMITDTYGFAGSASMFWGGAIGAFIGLVIGVFANIKIHQPLIRNWISVLVFLILAGCIILFQLGT